ncbi:hypothetical protein [Streptomyces roseolus]|uniref:hypothetical protein n=1 Tax=Streptomyces roseolus TaxID=67358 RepID=UPI0037AC60A2
MFALLPLLVALFYLVLVLVPSLDDRDSRPAPRTTPAPAVTQCGTTPTTSGAVPDAHRPGTVRPGRPSLKNPAAPKPPAVKAPSIRTR